MKSRLIAILAVIALSVPCLSAKEKVPNPSVTITAPVDAIKDALATVASTSGLVIESDTKYQMTLSQTVQPGLALAFTYGTGASAQQLMHFQFVQRDGQVSVTGNAETVVSNQNGTRHLPMNSDKDKLKIQAILDGLKLQVEKRAGGI